MPLSRLLPMVFAAAMSFHAGAGWSAEPVKIRVSWIAPISNWGSLLLEKKELAQHLGKSYVFEPVRYVGTPQMITALANDELEIANLAFSTLPRAWPASLGVTIAPTCGAAYRSRLWRSCREDRSPHWSGAKMRGCSSRISLPAFAALRRAGDQARHSLGDGGRFIRATASTHHTRSLSKVACTPLP